MAKRVDTVQAEIVAALRQVGGSIQHMHTLGRGAPDILCGFRGLNVLLELKSPGGSSTVHQVEWASKWNGQMCIVRTPEEAIAAVTGTGPRAVPLSWDDENIQAILKTCSVCGEPKYFSNWTASHCGCSK